MVVVASLASGTAEVMLCGTPLAVVYTDREIVVALWPRWLAMRYVQSCDECSGVLSRVGPGEYAMLLAVRGDHGDTDRIEAVRQRVVPTRT